MLNITFTRLCRAVCLTALCALALPQTAVSQAAPVPLGCYTRLYTDAHLSKHPNQIVRSMALLVSVDQTYGERLAAMGVEFANQGRIAGTSSAGAFMDQTLICWADDRAAGCSVECDGGIFVLTRDTGDSITIETKGLWVGDVEGCGGAETIAERPGQSVKYKLFKTSNDNCVWN